MEKAKFTWNDFDLVEKCKNRHTQRMLQTVKSATTSNAQVCVFYNKGKCKNDSDHVSSGILYQHAVHIVTKKQRKDMNIQLTSVCVGEMAIQKQKQEQ